MKSKVILILFGLLLFGCGSTKSEAEKAEDLAAFNEIKTLVNSKHFRFDAESAYPIQSSDVVDVNNVLFRQTENVGGRISLSGNEDFMTISGLNAEANLSYFGELRTSGYSDVRDSSIMFNADHSSFEITENVKKHQLDISFNVRNDVEQFIIKMVVFSNGYANVSIYGSNRTALRYRGQLSSIK